MATNSEIQQLRSEIGRLERERNRVLANPRYQLGRLLIDTARNPWQLPALPLRLIRFWKMLRQRRRPPIPGNTAFDSAEERLENFLGQVREGDSSHFVFLFSGTTYIQGTRGNRPIRQTQALLRRGVPVFFSYHRNDYSEPVPEDDVGSLVQIPVDITLQLLKKISGFDFGEIQKVFIVSYPHPGLVSEVEKFKDAGWKVIYDCRDDWEAFSRVGMARWYNPEVERRVVDESMATICVSSTLCEKMRKISSGSRVELSPNAVEADFLPASYRWQPHTSPRIVGYFGHLSNAWFDWSRFLEIARRCPNLKFEVIGHSEPVGLDIPQNVHLLGPKPWAELHKFASKWSVGVIPFRMGDLADGVDPIKIYEYLSFGLPVVSFIMPQIEDYPYTSIVDNVDDFCVALHKACCTTPERQVIDDFLARNTWEVRADELLALAGDVKS